MKRILILFSILAVTFSCGDNTPEDKFPITNLKLPASSSDHPIISGETVAISGQGFQSTGEIWFRVDSDAERDEIKAENITVTADGISFDAPQLSGTYSVILKQSGKEYSLGEMTFVEADNPSAAAKTLYAIKRSDPAIIYKIDKSTNLFTEYDRIDGVYPIGIVTGLEGYIYYTGESAGLYRYHAATKTQVVIAENWLEGFSPAGEGISVGIINNSLHGIKYNENTGYYLVSISENDGVETTVRTFGKIGDFQNYRYLSAKKFFKTTKDGKTGLVSGYLYDGDRDIPVLISFSVETENITYRIQSLSSGNDGDYHCLNVNDDVWLFSKVRNWESSNTKTTVSKIDPVSLSDMETISELNFEFVNPFYSEDQNLIYGIAYDRNNNDLSIIRTYDINSKNTGILDGTPDISQFFSIAE
ncbi:MAG: hypothetical protein LBH90_03340 [Tannerella sp.]|jgi:hypothetical protein|nr:hypothetical protein [Tannerella sp.]